MVNEPPAMHHRTRLAARRKARRAGDADLPNESEIKSLTHTQQSTFTRWLIKPTSEARNTGAAISATPREPQSSIVNHLLAEAQNSPFRMHMPQHISGSVLQSAMVGPRWPL